MTTTQLTFEATSDANHAIQQLTGAERTRWVECLDLLAHRGSLPLAWLGARDSRRFSTLGMLRYYGGVLLLTEFGEQCELGGAA